MNFVGLIFLLIAHYFCGRGVLRWFDLRLSFIAQTCLSLIIGIPVLSFVPCLLQLLSIPIILSSVNFGIVAVTILLSLPMLLNFKRPQFGKPLLPALYEWPFIIVMAVLMIVSVWRCFYYPPIARDMLTGPELIAEYTVREMTMINSVFSVDLTTTNNQFKSPYITGLQIIYKLLVSPFGQLWLSILSWSFVIWFYTILRNRVHPLIAGMLLLLFVAIPEMYAYTYLILYDYSNAVFFFCGFYFFCRYFSGNRINDFIFSALLFGLSTYIRTETLILIFMLLPLVVYTYYKTKVPLKQAVLNICIFFLIPVAFYFLCINVFVHKFVPLKLDIAGQVNHNLGDLTAYFSRLSDINSRIIFAEFGTRIFGEIVYAFLWVLLLDLIWIRKFSKEALLALYGIALMYFGIPLLGYLLPAVDLMNTSKRALFKMFPLIILYMSNSGALLLLSAKIRKWSSGEFKIKPATKVPVTATVKAKPAAIAKPKPAATKKRR